MSQHVLIVEDDPTIRALLSTLLNRAGYMVDVAENGAVGLEILKHRAGIDLIITDNQMPVMGGIELVRRVRERYGFHIKVMMYASPVEPRYLSPLLATGVRFVEKPRTPDELLAEVVKMYDLK